MTDNKKWVELESSPGIDSMSKDELREALIDASKLWLAHDGLWFLEWEKRHGMEEAIEADTAAWARFAKIEARRIMQRLGIEPGGGVDALADVLRNRLYSNICRFTLHRQGENMLKLRMVDCRVQQTRERQEMPLFPCKSVGEVEFKSLAKTVDPRITVECVQCPPDEVTEGGYCEWVFTLID